MFKLFLFFAALVAMTYAKPKPSVVVAGYTAGLGYASPLAYSAYTSPLAYSAYSAYSPYAAAAYTAPLAYSPYAAYPAYYR